MNVLMSVAQWERETIGERTRDALQHKIRKGERCGRVRFGFNLGADGKTLVPNPAEQEAIGIMRQLRAGGQTLREICDELNRQGIPTKGGGAWKPQTVANLLKRAA